MEHLLNINVHGVTGLKFADKGMAGTSPTSYVEVAVFGESRYTSTVKESSSADYESFFSIGKEIDPEEYLESDIKVTVWHKTWTGSMALGSVTFGLAKVYDHPQHMVRKNWFPIALPDKPADIMGFVQLTIGTYKPGDSVPRQAQTIEEEDQDGPVHIKSRMLQPPSAADQNLYQLFVYMYCAEGLKQIDGYLSGGCHPFVEVEFNGTCQRTEVMKNSINPAWNQEAKVPFNFPTMDDSISVRIASQGLTSETDIGKVSLSVEDIMEKKMDPTWFNFYHGPTQRSLTGEESKLAESEYGGRLLLGAYICRTEKPTLGIGATQPKPEPSPSNYVLHIDLYMLCFDAGHAIQDCWVTLTLAPMLVDAQSKSPMKQSDSKGTFMWDEENGRMPPIELSLPPIDQCSDLILCVYTSTAGVMGYTEEKHMYARMPCSSLYENERAVSPSWLEMLNANMGEYETNAGFMLCCCTLKRPAEPRPKRDEIRIRRYIFQAMIHQAVNLPAADEIGSSDPYIVIFFGSAHVITPIYQGSLSPVWHIVLRKEVELPEREAMRPDILIFILDKDPAGDEPLAMYRHSVKEFGALPVQNRGAPKWLELDEAPGGPLTQGKLLCSFEMFPADKAAEYERDDIYPETIDCRVEIFIIGIRLDDMQDIGNPFLEVSWGRKDRDKPDIWVTPKKCRTTTLYGHTGANGNYNFMEKLVLSPCQLPVDPLFQEFLEIKLFCDKEGTSEESCVKCFSSVHLTPLCPWLTREQSEKAKSAHRCKRISEVKQEDVLQQQGKFIGVNADKSDDEDEDDEHPDIGDDEHDDETVSLLKEDREAVQKRKADAMVSEKEKELANVLGWSCSSISEANSTAMDINEYKVATDAQKRLYQLDVDKCEELAQRLVRTEEEDEFSRMLQAFQTRFKWPLIKDRDDNFDGDHLDIDDEIEREGNQLPVNDLEYRTSPLFIGDEGGNQKQIGTLKFVVRVVEKERYKEDSPAMQKENRSFQARIEKLMRDWKEAKDLVLRCYILSADGLAPVSGQSECTTYVWSYAAAVDRGDHQMKDIGTCREHTLYPEFNTFHRIAHCQFPDNARLGVMVMEHMVSITGGKSEAMIGSTLIDLEDRWFHKRFRTMVKTGSTPIEARRLFGDHSHFGRGHVRLWIDIVTEKEVESIKPTLLPSTESVDHELRVVIWKLTDIKTVSGGLPTCQISGKVYPDGSQPIEKWTDQHSCHDDSASFNWRLLFPVKVPCGNCKLQLSAWDVGTLSTDLIAQITLDLSRDYLHAKRTGTEAELPRGKVRMYHVNEPGAVRGQMDLQILLLSQSDAVSRKVGEGRDEPNREPFLDPEDPHLLKGREGILGKLADAAAVAGNVFALAGKMAMIMLVLKVVAGGAASLFAAYMTYAVATK